MHLHYIPVFISDARTVVCYHSYNKSLINGTYDACLDNIHSGQLPRRVFVSFVSNTAFCGYYNLNPFKFDHFNISSLDIYFD